jgi:CheY-like chemotaxis protein/anti-sigma regulatory factor (Ser/Thr protein kinase)
VAALGDIIDQAVQLAEPLISARRHTLEVEIHQRDVALYVDATRLTQVASNLLNNAAKYTPVGGHIRIATRAAAGDAVEIVVSDNGIGIRAEALPRIFDIFVQADYPSDRAHSGLGIGLTLAKRLMQLHGGDVTAASDGPNRGSTFTVHIPLTTAVATEVPTAMAAAGGDRSLKIVIIEDNVDVRETVAELLRLEGHEVHEAGDAQKGIALVADMSPDVALVDVGLPGRDGYSVARELSELRRVREMPLRLIAMTGYGRAEDKQRAEEAGFDTHLVKPVEPHLLLAALAARSNDDRREI